MFLYVVCYFVKFDQNYHWYNIDIILFNYIEIYIFELFIFNFVQFLILLKL